MRLSIFRFRFNFIIRTLDINKSSHLNIPSKSSIFLDFEFLKSNLKKVKWPINCKINLKNFKWPLFSAFSAAYFYKLTVPKFVVYCKTKNYNKIDELQEKNTKISMPWKELLNLLLPDIWMLIAALISAVLIAFINTQIPLLLGSVVNVLAKYTTTSNTQQFKQDMKIPTLKLASLYAANGLMTFVYISLLSAVGERMACRLRNKLFASIIVQDISFFNDNRTGDIVGRLTIDIQDFKSSFKMVITQGIRNVTQICGCIISLFILSPKLTICMMGVVGSIIIVGSSIGGALRLLSNAVQIQFSRVIVVAEEAIGNISTVRTFAAEQVEMRVFERETEESSYMSQKLGLCIGAFQGLSNIALNGLVLGTLYIGGYMISDQEIDAGTLMTFLVSTQIIQRSLSQISVLFGHVMKGMAAGTRAFEFMKLKPTMNVKGGGKIPFHFLKGDVTFNDVSFFYPNRKEKMVLENFNLTIPAGKTVALVGMSGGGKSTIASLLCRLYDPNSGKVTLDGVDLKALDPSWYRGTVIGFISQEPILFAATLRENIRYGKPNATNAEIEEAAKLANAHDFIESFPRGYDTVVGERGGTISAGQKQRIAIARALIKNPSILILDEATSALDSESEKIIQEALDAATRGRTVLVIAHRLSTIYNADYIALIRNGRIVEAATHKELMDRKGAYFDLINSQQYRSNG